jgi:hypothetical protein
VVSIACCIGEGNVAVSEEWTGVTLALSDPGCGSGGGSEKSLEVRRRFALGDRRRTAIGNAYILSLSTKYSTMSINLAPRTLD